ncbi:MAG: SIS domain-containing protein [Actinomycetota bacterium]|nr:SIS domain-containing protein [Actinomycetota bacterium]
MSKSAPEFVRKQYALRDDLVRSFFSAEAAAVALLCHDMARRFARGGRLIAFGAGAAATDAQHLSVEFVHPVIVGKRALPALALVNDVSALGAALTDASGFFARRLELMAREQDVAVGIVHGAEDPGREAVAAALKQASALGMLTLSLGASDTAAAADHVFEVPSRDRFIVQEVQETLYHLVWELVHVFFEHKGLLDDRDERSTHHTGRSSFLYPFLAEQEKGLDTVLTQLERSVVDKASDVCAMRASSIEPEALTETARLIAERVSAGGKVLAFGNGGSATDAQDLVGDLVGPPRGMKPVPAVSLTNDEAVMTALGNDVGFENVFVRQVIAHAHQSDVAIAISTSGGSRNVVAAVEEAKRRGLLTVGLAGYGGGRLAEVCDRTHSITGDYIPRIQEAQASQYHVLRRLIDAAVVAREGDA